MIDNSLRLDFLRDKIDCSIAKEFVIKKKEKEYLGHTVCIISNK